MANIYANMSIGQFVKVREILTSDRDIDDKMIALASMLQGISEDELLDMKITEARTVFHVLDGLDEQPKATRAKKKYKVGEWNLRLCDVDDTCVAQWIDYQNFARLGVEEHMVDILSVALIPEGKKYNEGYDMKKLREDLTEGMTIADARAVCFFFQRKYLKSMRHILTFLIGWSNLKLKGRERKMMKGKALKARREISDMLRSL